MANVSLPSVQQIFTTNNTNTTKPTTPFETQNSFASVLKDSIAQLNQSQVDADNMTNKLINGDNVDLSQVMIAQQKANVTLQAAVEVRNKVIDAYQEMMRMQV
ncbi:flagellar hook-basal body complex protein FliE [Neobacillus sp. PS3-12]|jgi:flagellar hook-basal body complex protein FliE|uniref:flagellar hook-basal body complex protein FliE n=1 Tax=Neobacillus sp. PS3-12 TaxID=3070677 RepID=UPI0027E06AAA|nr:flagellar hook-basal body complex protein FliE [Neobacillus sp. PS3-12]WML51995.1 flagellar hook-basal body complex protein FliE [Neobacillus sp. PS3-12]